MNRDEVYEELKSFIVREILQGDDAGLDSSTPLLKLGVINSMSRLMLVQFINKRFSLSVSAQELDGDKLESLKTMADAVVSLRDAPGDD